MNDVTFQLFRAWETLVRTFEPQLKTPGVSAKMVKQCQSVDYEKTVILNCHNITNRLAKKYVNLRIHIFCRKWNKKVTSGDANLGSKTMRRKKVVK